MKYVKLEDVEKILIKRIDWKSDKVNPIEIRNDLLESLDMIDSIDISEGCKYCLEEYDKAHVNVNYCPVCGRKLR